MWPLWLLELAASWGAVAVALKVRLAYDLLQKWNMCKAFCPSVWYRVMNVQ